MATSNKPNDIIKTFALATCVGVTVFCPVTSSAGMVHVVLPDHRDASSYISKAGYFATIGVPLLITKMIKSYGCQKSDLRVQLFGGASSLNNNDYFMIGKRNIDSVSTILSEMGIPYVRTAVGGNVSRTIALQVTNGQVSISAQAMKI